MDPNQPAVKDWRKEEGKIEAIRAAYGDQVPQYLWYALDPFGQLGHDVLEKLNRELFEGAARFGDLEVHRAKHGGYVLRVRHTKTLALIVKIENVSCPLVAVGYEPNDGDKFVNFKGPQHENVRNWLD